MTAYENTDKVWKNVGAIYERMEAEAPEGFVPRVQVTLFDGQTFEPGAVGEYANSEWNACGSAAAGYGGGGRVAAASASRITSSKRS